MDGLSDYFDNHDTVIISKSDFEKFYKELSTFFAHRTTVTEEDEIAVIKYFYSIFLFHILGLMTNHTKI